MTTTTSNTIGQRLAAALGLTIIGTEGHDLKMACVSCKSSDAARLHQDEGVYHCYSCGKDLSPWDLCKVVVGHDQAKRVMHAVGLYAEVYEGGKGNDGHAADGNGKSMSDDEVLAEVARLKGCSVAGLKAYGATVKAKAVMFPMFGPDGKSCSSFRLDLTGSKGLNAKGKPTGLFLPVHTVGDKKKVRFPDAAENWILTEGIKNCAAYHDLGLVAAGTPGMALRLKEEFVPVFKGVNLTLAPDGDRKSLEGSAQSAKMLSGVAQSVRQARLPYKEIRDSHGDDVRDILKKLGAKACDQILLSIQEAQSLGSDGKPVEPPRFAEVIDCPTFLALDLQTHYLIPHVLVGGQPAVVGGRSKTLKTSLALAMAIALASGTKFLDRFPAVQTNVAFWSGESGPATIRETALRIAKAMGVDLAQCPILWGFDLPRLSEQSHLDILAGIIDTHKVGGVFIDPTYLCMGGEAATQAGNVYAMGEIFSRVSRVGQKTGATIVLLHHFRKTGLVDDAEPAGLEELAQSGMAEWARQWLLLQRRSPYQADGKHSLWMRTGGSAGHAGLWGVDINEGVFDPDFPTGRHWEVEVKAVADAREQTKREKENRKAQEQEAREGDHRQRVMDAARQFPEGATARTLREAAGLNSQNFSRAVQSLVQQGKLTPCEVTTTRGKYDGYRRV